MSYLTRSNEIAGPYGKYPGSRTVEELLRNGIIILDKWPGPTSHDVSAIIKQKLGLQKAGHAGTLDPAVTGVLLVTLENACKVIPALQHLAKEYVGVMHLHKDVDDKTLDQAVTKSVGTISQTPPVRSAVARKARKRTVYSFDVLERDDRNVLFRIRCEAGTYVRVVCHEIGKRVGGGHMAELRRTMSGPFTENRAARIQDLADAYHNYKESGSEEIRDFVLPVELAVAHLPQIIIKDSAVFSVARGSAVYTGGVSRLSSSIKTNDLVAVLTLKGELVALAKAAMDAKDMMARKGLAAKTDRVVIDKEAYPKNS